jgi:hypothetical protein
MKRAREPALGGERSRERWCAERGDGDACSHTPTSIINAKKSPVQEMTIPH